MKSKGIIAVIITFLFVKGLFALTAGEILDKSEALPKPKSAHSKMIMKIYKEGSVAEKEFESSGREADNMDMALLSFTRPTKIKFLSHSRKDGESDQWIALSSGKIKRIAMTDKDKPFVNSHFFYEDMGGERKNKIDFNLTLLQEKKILGADCYVIEALPKPLKRKIYDKSVLYIRKADFFPVRIDLYFRGEYFKYLEVVEDKVIDGIITPLKIVMTRVDGSGKTEIILEKGYPKYNVDIKQSMFNPQNLR